MGRRKKDSLKISVVQGQHRWTQGRWINSRGNLEAKKWVLPRDPGAAQLAAGLLQSLWAQVEADWELYENNDIEMKPGPPTYYDPRPRWTRETLPLAEAARKARTAAVCPRRPDEDAVAYARRIADLRRRYPAVTAVPEDEATYQMGLSQQVAVADSLAVRARNLRAMHTGRSVDLTGYRVHAAIEQFADRCLAKSKKEYGRVESRQARKLKDCVADVDLGDLGLEMIEKMAAYWRARPASRTKKKTPIALTTVAEQLKVLRRFLRWLDERDDIPWRLPRRAIEATKMNTRSLRTAEETSRMSRGVEVFSVEQLKLIWRHANDPERLLILLALNAGMSHAELCSLRWDEIHEDEIRRIRHKSGVYARFKLWPETQAALKWWAGIRGRQELVLVSLKGEPYTRNRITKTWSRLGRKIARCDDATPGWLSFKHLRKTAAYLVRQASDGETMKVFLSHGQPVDDDPLADDYSPRLFERVGEALEKVREKLAPVFAAADAFTSTSVGGRGPRQRQVS